VKAYATEHFSGLETHYPTANVVPQMSSKSMAVKKDKTNI